MHGIFGRLLKDMDHTIEEKGDTLVITVKGEPEELKKMKKVLEAIRDLHEACDCDDEECGCGHGHCC